MTSPTPKFLKRITVDDTNNEGKVLFEDVDGVTELPWYLAEDGVQIEYEGGAAKVWLCFLADEAEIKTSLAGRP